MLKENIDEARALEIFAIVIGPKGQNISIGHPN